MLNDADGVDTACAAVSENEEVPTGVVSADVETTTCPPPGGALVTPGISSSIGWPAGIAKPEMVQVAVA